MIRYISNPNLEGWYYITEEGTPYGDGTKETAKRIEAEFETI